MLFKDLPDSINYCSHTSCVECEYSATCWGQIKPIDMDDQCLEIAKTISRNFGVDIGDGDYTCKENTIILRTDD